MTEKTDAELMSFIGAMSDNQRRVEAMPDKELADTLRDDVWAFAEMDSMESALVGEAVRRLSECPLPPDGWRCTRGKGHEGPCASVETSDCKHTIGTSVDEDGCCSSCGEDINHVPTLNATKPEGEL